MKLRRRLETMSEKNEAKIQQRDGLDIVDGSDVVYLRCSKEFVFPEETWVEGSIMKKSF